MKIRNFIIGILVLLGLGCITLFILYQVYTSPIDKTSNANIEVVIPNGMNTQNIGKLLKNKGLIRSDFVFKLYLKVNHISSLKASTYTLKKSMSMEDIVNTIEKEINIIQMRLPLLLKKEKTLQILHKKLPKRLIMVMKKSSL